MILDIVRKIVPIRYRQSLGLRSAHQASRSRLTLYPYLFFLCGAIPKNLKLLPNDKCAVCYKGCEVVFPRDGIFTSWEVLQDEIYERLYTPEAGDVVVDIGAYIGMFTVKASLQVKEAGKVIAIEPADTNLEYLRVNTTNLLSLIHI